MTAFAVGDVAGAEQTCWLTVRKGPGPSLEDFRSDSDVEALLDQIYDGARPAPKTRTGA